MLANGSAPMLATTAPPDAHLAVGGDMLDRRNLPAPPTAAAPGTGNEPSCTVTMPKTAAEVQQDQEPTASPAAVTTIAAAMQSQSSEGLPSVTSDTGVAQDGTERCSTTTPFGGGTAPQKEKSAAAIDEASAPLRPAPRQPAPSRLPPPTGSKPEGFFAATSPSAPEAKLSEVYKAPYQAAAPGIVKIDRFPTPNVSQTSPHGGDAAPAVPTPAAAAADMQDKQPPPSKSIAAGEKPAEAVDAAAAEAPAKKEQGSATASVSDKAGTVAVGAVAVGASATPFAADKGAADGPTSMDVEPFQDEASAPTTNADATQSPVKPSAAVTPTELPLTVATAGEPEISRKRKERDSEERGNNNRTVVLSSSPPVVAKRTVVSGDCVEHIAPNKVPREKEGTKEPSAADILEAAAVNWQVNKNYAEEEAPSFDWSDNAKGLVKDTPLGEGWDEHGNDLSKIANEAIRKAQCEAWVAKLRQEASAIRSGDHPEVLRRSVLTVRASKRRLEMTEKNSRRQKNTAENLYELELKSVQASYEAAVEQTRDRLMGEVNEEIRRSKSRLEGFKEVENRMNTRHTRGNAKCSIDDLWLASGSGTKSNGSSKRPLCPVTLVLEDEDAVEDIEYLRYGGHSHNSGGGGGGSGGSYGDYGDAAPSSSGGRSRRAPSWRRDD